MSSPDPPHRHKGTSKPLAVPLGRVGLAIVGDDERFRLVLQEILDQSRKFHCVGSYSSGEEALIGIPQSGAQVVLMDIRMPGMNGIECARHLKVMLPHLVIVMVTGFDDPRMIDLARECGADQFLPKGNSACAGNRCGVIAFFGKRRTEGASSARESCQELNAR